VLDQTVGFLWGAPEVRILGEEEEEEEGGFDAF